jgi:ribosome-binding protein aMBF1 (putative translation factor)
MKKESKERRNAWKNDYKKRKDYCELCGSKEKLEFHHIDYIDHSGITVCFNCHRYKIHNKGKREEI